jgi:hypothetical protein
MRQEQGRTDPSLDGRAGELMILDRKEISGDVSSKGPVEGPKCTGETQK